MCRAVGRSERRALGVVVGFFGVAYGLYGLFRHWNFGSSAFDLGIFDQVVWHLSRFEPPGSSIRGLQQFSRRSLFSGHRPLRSLLLDQCRAGDADRRPGSAALRRRSCRCTCSSAAASRRGRPSGWRSRTAVSGAFSARSRSTSTRPRSRRWSLPSRFSRWIASAGRCSGYPSSRCCSSRRITFRSWLALGMLLVIQGERRRGLIAIAGSVAAMVAVVGVVIPAFNDLGGYRYTSSYLGVLAESVADSAVDGVSADQDRDGAAVVCAVRVPVTRVSPGAAGRPVRLTRFLSD